MLIDTHCHINMMVKKEFDVALSPEEISAAQTIITAAAEHDVTHGINVGTNSIESSNCVALAQRYEHWYAAVGIHPSPHDLKDDWREQLAAMRTRWFSDANDHATHKIVAIGEIGLDYHYPEHNKARQHIAFRDQIEWALEYKLPVIIHTRDAGDTTLKVLEEYKRDALRGVIHCFSEDQAFADYAIKLGFVLGIGGTLTYPKNNALREIFKTVPLEKIILETDAPFLPPQIMRGKQNSPANIQLIAHYIAELRGISYEEVAQTTTATARNLFALP